MRLTVSEAARHFSAVLGRVAAGEEIEVVRNGAPVAVIAPPRSSEPFGEPLEWTPNADGSFADDIRALRAELKLPEDAWGPLDA
jgi:prevent-host-death family protein